MHRRRSWLRFFLKWGLILAGLGLLVFLAGLAYFSKEAGKFDLSKLGAMPQRSVVYDLTGQTVLGKLHGANRVNIPLDKSSRFFIDALLAREDRNFYKHGGVDYRGVARAIVRNIKDRKWVQGASTISMQLARNSYGLTEESLHRKLLEVALTRRIESNLSKNQILELYINRIFFGGGFYGLERASQAYFNKSASDLELGEAAMLAGIIRSPNRFSPLSNFPGALRERDDVLAAMVKVGSITAEEEKIAKETPIKVREEGLVIAQEDYAMDYVRRELNRILDQEDVEDGGLLIHTTISQELQQAAEQAADKRLKEVEKTPGYEHPTFASFEANFKEGQEKPIPYLQGSVVLLDNSSGGVLALVGGRDYRHSKFNRAVQAMRQIGSSFKPFVFASAYEHAGLFPQSLLSDDMIDPEELSEFGVRWNPHNSDNTYRGLQTVAFGLIKSRNTLAVRVGLLAGIDNVVELARQLYLNDKVPRNPTSFIGAFESSLLWLASAYSVLPNEGIRKRPFIIAKIVEPSGRVIYQNQEVAYRAISAGACSLVNESLKEVMVSGTAARSRQLGWKDPAAGKTGTTDNYRDAWFVGYTDKLTCGVWVGLDSNEPTVAKGYGGTLALPIWVDVMTAAKAQGYTPEELPLGPHRVSMQLCQLSGGLATRSCEAHGTAVHVDLPEELVGTRGPCGQHRGTPERIPTAGPPPDQDEDFGRRPPQGPGFWRGFRRLFGR